MLRFKALGLCYSGCNEFHSQGDSVQEMFFPVNAHIIVTITTSITEGKAKPQGSVREMGTDLRLSPIE